MGGDHLGLIRNLEMKSVNPSFISHSHLPTVSSDLLEAREFNFFNLDSFL